MDWKIFIATFGTIFVAELGDKTQLTAIMMAAQSKSPWVVFLAAILALTAITLLSVLLAQVMTQYIPMEWIKKVAGAGFMLLGVLVLLDFL